MLVYFIGSDNFRMINSDIVIRTDWTASMYTDLIGYLAGILLMTTFLPQLYRTWRRKSADDVSMMMLVLMLGSGVGYEIYAWLLGLTPVVVMNGIFSVLVAAEIVLKIRYDGLWERLARQSSNQL